MIFIFFRKQAANILTLINLLLGLVALLFAFKNNYTYGCLFILIAAATDFLDGLVARKLKITSDFGKYLDSNADLISFGIAPGFLLYFSVLNQFGFIGIAVSFLFIMCGAIRLARYNAVKFSGFYVGVPITIAGAILASSIFAAPYISANAYIFIALILSYLMVSTHRIKKV